MTDTATRVAVIGAGAWGTALAAAVARNGTGVTLWGRDRRVLDAVRLEQQNPRYLPGIQLPAGINTTDDLDAAARACALILATPSHTFRAMLRQLGDRLAMGTPLVWACKGIEPDSHLKQLEKISDRPLILYDDGGLDAQKAARKLAANGIRQQLYEIEGGLPAWRKADLPVESGGANKANKGKAKKNKKG